jgi:hypothetical protein
MQLAFYTYSYTDRLKMSISDCLERNANTGYSEIGATELPSGSVKSKEPQNERRERLENSYLLAEDAK